MQISSLSSLTGFFHISTQPMAAETAGMVEEETLADVVLMVS
jgi:hypothetical protein